MRGVIYALTASLLFGITTPFAKSLLEQISPVLLAGLFYLGSGLGLGIYLLTGKLTQRQSQEASLQKKDLPALMAAVLCGGIIAPVCLMLGLATTQASSASLFLNLESVLTAVIAWFIFKENFDRRLLIGMLVIVAGGVLLSVNFSGQITVSYGVLLIALACLGWGFDNNFTRMVSDANPAQIACLKGLVAGVTNVSLAMLLGAKMPPLHFAGAAMFVGFLGYGVSLTLFVLALRHIGTARTGAYFSLAPFAGALIALVMLREPLTIQFATAGILMGIGLWLHLTEDHAHEHEHLPMEHDHEHEHDEHHQHVHADGSVLPPGVKHSHLHEHEHLVHSHAHFPDTHHRHSH